ncbi:MAG: aldehyde dehydrogenase [Chryseolinea sp.]
MKPRILNYINGELVAAITGLYLDNYDPSTGMVYSLLPDSDGNDVESAVESARNAFAEWSAIGAKRRSEVLLRIADLIDRDIATLAAAESVDTGKTVSLAMSLDIPRASANLRFFATAVLHTSSETHITEGAAINYTQRAPIGIAGCISPWNLPLYLFTWKIAPALAVGCTVVAKPSELTPMTAFLFSRLCIEAGLPKGVLNIVHGVGGKVGSAIVQHPDVSAISFTGGTATGKKIAAAAGPLFKKTSLELGGKNPNIIFADCDFKSAVSTAIQSSFSNQGEICLCGSRILVEKPLFETFVEEFVRQTKLLVVGDPSKKDTTVGALISATHKEKILSYIELARSEGGTILTGGHAVELEGRCGHGYFVAPTVIVDLDQNCRTNQEEIFGPVVTISSFENEAEAIAFANGTDYGLSATIWTENLSRAHRVSSAIQCGIIWVNCWLLRDLRTPFGGMKQSGVGREGGTEALNFFTEMKNICIKI